MRGRIVIVTGPPGTGKSTAAETAAWASDMEKSICIRTDDFYHYLKKGAIPPHLPESDTQNGVVIEALQAGPQDQRRTGGGDVGTVLRFGKIRGVCDRYNKADRCGNGGYKSVCEKRRKPYPLKILFLPIVRLQIKGRSILRMNRRKNLWKG